MGKKNRVKSEKEEQDDILEGDDNVKGGKKSKKSRKKDFDEDDIARELQELSIEVNGDLPESTKSVEPRAASEDQQISDDKSSVGDNSKKSKAKPKEEIKDAKEEEKTKSQKAKQKKQEKEESSVANENQAKKEKSKGAEAPKEKPKGSESSKEKSKSAESSTKKAKGKSKEETKKEEDESKSRKGKPNKKMLEAMKELIAKQKEAEERMRKEEEERIKLENERIRKLKEQRQLEKERKERLKQKQKERLKRMKEEGRYLTPKQKLEQKRARAMLEHLKAQGVAIPEAGEKLPASASYKKQKKKKQQEEELEGAKMEEDNTGTEEKQESLEDEGGEEEDEQTEEIEEEDDVIDAWDQLSESVEDEETEEMEDDEEQEGKSDSPDIHISISTDPKINENGEEKMEEEDESSRIHQSESEKRRDRALMRMEQRKVQNEKNRTEDRLRAPVVCVLGHVDHGKTKILDKLRRTNVQEGEVGGITQQIGATNVPIESIRSQTRMVKDFVLDDISMPGLLIIDTPGHESFSNLRSRGSSLCDIAILVVDITQGLEPQTIESITLLKKKKTPFVVALNKVDRVFEWESHPSKDIRDTIKVQNEPCKNNFDKRTSEIIQALNMEGLNAALFWENPDPRSYVSLVPTSAISGDGMGNLMSLVVSMCQKRLSKRLMFSEELQCTVLEVKTIQGHGTTIDVILINGQLKEGDTVVLAGTEGPIVTQIRSLLIPKPMKEIRVKGQYDELKVVQAALGVKIAARDLEKAIAGLNLQVAHHEDEVDILKEEVDQEFKSAMRSIKVRDRGVYVQASTLGALEALLEFFKANDVPYSGIRVGPVVKRDVMRASAMLEHNPMYAVILAFDVKVEKDAQELADKEGIKIFSEETIYHLGDRYVEYIKEYKKKKQDEFRHVAVFPCKLKILPDAVFNKRDPIVLGVTVDAGILRTGTPLCVPSKEFVEIGVVTSLEFDHKVVEIAKKGVSVCMKVEPLPGHAPRLFGRHFDFDDILVSKISRDSIDACKQYFRDDLGKNEWKLMAELKKQFSIL